MKRIQFSDLARNDLDEIWFSIAIENLSAADRTVDRIDGLLKKLLEFPEIGSERDDIRAGGLRSFPCGNYLVFYRQMSSGIAVVRIVYGGRDLEALEYPLQWSAKKRAAATGFTWRSAIRNAASPEACALS